MEDREALGIHDHLALRRVGGGHLPNLAWHRTFLNASLQTMPNLPTSIGIITQSKNTLHGKYREDTGTSMAAPHVSGVIAAYYR